MSTINVELFQHNENVRVYKRKRNDDEVMVKEYDIKHMNEKEKERMERELQILKETNNRYIVHYLDFERCEDKMRITLEYFHESTLEDYIKQARDSHRHFQEHTIKRCLSNLILGLRYLHTPRGEDKKYIIHRYINPKTVMISLGGEFVLGDLGMARGTNVDSSVMSVSLTNSTASSIMSSPQYICYYAPEMWKNDYDCEVDLWSIGCLLYEMCTLITPPITFQNYTNLLSDYPNNTTSTTSSSSSRSGLKLRKIDETYYSDELRKIIDHLLEVDPKKRYSTEDILNSKYMREYMNYEKEGKEHNDEEDDGNIPINLDLYLQHDDNNNDDNDDNTGTKRTANSLTVESTPNTPVLSNNNNNNATVITRKTVIEDDSNNTVERVFKGEICSKPSKINIINSIKSNDYSWITSIEDRKWFVPIKENMNDGVPYFHDDDEIRRFFSDRILSSVYERIVNVLMNFYGYTVIDMNDELIVGQTDDGIRRFKIWFRGNLEVVFMRRFLNSLKITNHRFFPLLYRRLLDCCKDSDFVSDTDYAKAKFRNNFLSVMEGCEKHKNLYKSAAKWCDSSD